MSTLPSRGRKRSRRSRRSRRLKVLIWGLLLCLPLGAAAIFIATRGWDGLVSTRTRVARAESDLAEGAFGSASVELKKALLRSPRDARALAAHARLQWKMGDAEGAQADMDQALKAGAPANEELGLRCEILLARGRFAELAQLLDADRTLAPVRRLTLLSAAQAGLHDYASADRSIAAALQSSPTDSGALLQRARLLAAEHRYPEAVQATDATLAVDPHMAAAWLVRGQLLLLQGDNRQSVAALQKSMESAPRQLERPRLAALLAALAEGQIRLGDATAAATTLKQIDARFRDSVLSRFLRARLAMLNKDYDSAVTSLQLLLKDRSDMLPARMMLAQALLARGDTLWASEELKHLVAQHPDSLAARKLLAEADLKLHDPVAARAVMDAAPPHNGDTQTEWLPGQAYGETGGASTGLSYPEHSVASAPQSLDSPLALARAYISAGRSEDALALLKQLKPQERNLDSQALLVSATAAGKTPEAARAAIAQLVAQDPGDVSLLTATGSYWASIGDLEEAQRALSRATELDANNIPALMALASVRLRQAKPDAADDLLKTVLRLDRKQEAAYIERARIAQQRGDRNGARKLLSDAVSFDPASVQARLQLAQLALGDGNAAVARSLIDQAADVAKDRPQVLRAAGDMLLSANQPDEALKRFAAARAAGSADAAIDVARAQIALHRLADARATLEAIAGPAAVRQRAQVQLVELDVREKKLDDARALVGRLSTSGLPKYAIDELRGNVDLAAGQYQAASDAFAAAMQQRPTGALAIKEFQARRAGSLSAPEDPLRQWLQKTPADLNVRLALAQYYQESGKFTQATGEYERLASQPSPAQPLILNNLAWLYLRSGDTRCVELARRAYQMAPGTGKIADTYGWALVSNGNLDAGLPLLEKAAAAEPHDADVKYHLAAAYERHGEKARAADLLRELLKSPAKFATRPAAEQLLRKVASS